MKCLDCLIFFSINGRPVSGASFADPALPASFLVDGDSLCTSHAVERVQRLADQG